jgi:quercetin dioxygenase-like cupin family protein
MLKKKKRYTYSIKDLPETPLLEDVDNINARFLLGDNILISFFEQPPGVEFPLHEHKSEQVLIVLEGSAEMVIDGELILLKAGDVGIIPPNIQHGSKTPNGIKGIDIFSPPRESHVELMKKHGTMPDVEGNYPKK